MQSRKRIYDVHLSDATSQVKVQHTKYPNVQVQEGEENRFEKNRIADAMRTCAGEKIRCVIVQQSS
jgi:hypothetical protein